MLTRLKVTNFKKFDDIDIELGNPVVFIGPNDCGKTSALQVIALWNYGVKKWIEKKSDSKARKKPGVSIPIKELLNIPSKYADLFWKDKKVRIAHKGILIEIVVEGITNGIKWECAIELEYHDKETIICRPLRVDDLGEYRHSIPSNEVTNVSVTYLPPMSGLATTENQLTPGTVDVLIGEGQTAQILRNLCYEVIYPDNIANNPNYDKWNNMKKTIKELFGITVKEPVFNKTRGEISMDYVDLNNVTLDLSVSGRGFQQVLLLLAIMTARPSSVILLDEPDAHLEILRQQEIYNTLSEYAVDNKSQIIIATHSEKILEEAAGRDTVIAFLGKPHPLIGRPNQLMKALKEINFEQYYLSQINGWVLYLEGSTDLSILREFAKKLNHNAQKFLERPFVNYFANHHPKVRSNFYGLKEAVPDILGISIYDRKDLPEDKPRDLIEYSWKRMEIENYFIYPAVLLRFAESTDRDNTISLESDMRRRTMEDIINKLVPPIALENKDDSYWLDTKITDDLLDRLFEMFFKKLGLPITLRKGSYHQLASFMKAEEIPNEIIEVLNMINDVAIKAEELVSR